MTAKPEIQSPMASVETAVRQALDTWFKTYNSGEIEQCAATYTDNATILLSDDPAIQGSEAILRAHREWRLAEPGIEKSYELLECGGGGEWAYCLNTFLGRNPPSEGGAEVLGGIVHNVLRRQSDGSLKFYITSMHMTGAE